MHIKMAKKTKARRRSYPRSEDDWVRQPMRFATGMVGIAIGLHKYTEKRVKVGTKVVGHKEKVAYTGEGWYMKKVPIREGVYKTKRKLESPAIKEALSRQVKPVGLKTLKKFKKYLLDEKRRIRVRIGGR